MYGRQVLKGGISEHRRKIINKFFGIILLMPSPASVAGLVVL